MTSSTPVPDLLDRPLADLAAWTEHFRRAPIPILQETVEALELLRANEERTDANSIGETIGGDPLMALNVLVHASAHRSRSVVTGAETVIAAIVMLGVPPFFRAFEAPLAVETRLAGWPAARRGLAGVMRRAHRGARFALAFAVHRADPNAATVHAAALLHEFAEMLLWCHAPVLAQAIAALQEADPELRSSVAQRRVLGVELAPLQQALVREWQLPSLLVDVPGERQALASGPRNVALAARLARHTGSGWDNAAVPDDVSEIAGFLNLSPAATLDLLNEIDAA